MTVIVDTGPLVARMNRDAPRHDRARSLMDLVQSGRYGVPILTDLVLDEGMTLLGRRPGLKNVSQGLADRFWGRVGPGPAPFETRFTDKQAYQAATELHLSHYDQGLSFTDAALIVHARELDASVATFDRGFRGLVPVLPEPGDS